MENTVLQRKEGRKRMMNILLIQEILCIINSSNLKFTEQKIVIMMRRSKHRVSIKRFYALIVALIPISAFWFWSRIFTNDRRGGTDLLNTIEELLIDATPTTPTTPTTATEKSTDDDFQEGVKLLREMKREKKAKRKWREKKDNLKKNNTSSFVDSSTSYELSNDGGVPRNFIASSKYAYMFLIAGCNPKDPVYLGYIYNVVVAKELLQSYGSMQDIIVMVRMHADTNDTKLPSEHERIMTKLGLTVVYLPKPKIDNFHTAMMDKFRILQFTNYERVFYLDADVIPLNNLDYMFHLSSGANPRLEENTVLMYYNEPANGGFFILTPHENDYKEIVKLIEKVEDKGYHFNTTIGWGHEFVPPDHWASMRSKSGKGANTTKWDNGTKWDFYGAFTDQGLLYHWTKYVKQKVSIIARDKVQSWRTADDGSGNVQMVKEVLSKEVFEHASPSEYTIKPLHGNRDKEILTIVPYRDFHHCRERFKPWMHLNAKNPPADVKDISEVTGGPIQLWFHVLRKINKEHGFGIDTENLTMKKPTLGLYPRNTMVQDVKDAKSKES